MFRSVYTRNASLFVVISAVALLAGSTIPDDRIPIGSFSSVQGDTPLVDGWKELTFGKKVQPTAYELINMEGTQVIRAQSSNTASGLVKEVRIEPESYPFLEWSWMVNNVLENGDVTQKAGDDFAARIYVTFEYSAKDLPLGERIKYNALKLLGYDEIPLRALNYIWSNKAPAGTITPNAYTGWVQMVAVRDREDAFNTWHKEKRNVVEDYIEAFGEAPGAITGIAIMTDTDNTGESAMAYFGDIQLHQAPSTKLD